MRCYERYVLPRLINLAMQSRVVMAERARLLPRARGAVLEVGVGSGLNLPLYGPGVERLYGLDPSLELWRLARRRARAVPFPLAFLQARAEAIPLPAGSCDTVVSTFSLCSIPDAEAALGEMRRVLRPEGRLIFIEHGRSPAPRVLAWQNRLGPIWRRIAGGCTLNRQMDALVRAAGFRITELEVGYSRGFKPFAYLYRGLASPGP